MTIFCSPRPNTDLRLLHPISQWDAGYLILTLCKFTLTFITARNMSSMALREILLFSIHITQTLPHECQHRLSINSVDCSTHEKLHSRLNVNENFLCISIETSIADVRQQKQCSCCNFFAVFSDSFISDITSTAQVKKKTEWIESDTSSFLLF